MKLKHLQPEYLVNPFVDLKKYSTNHSCKDYAHLARIVKKPLFNQFDMVS